MATYSSLRLIHVMGKTLKILDRRTIDILIPTVELNGSNMLGTIKDSSSQG